VPSSIFAVVGTYLLVHVEEPEAADPKDRYAGVNMGSLGWLISYWSPSQVDDWVWGYPKSSGLRVWPRS